MRTRETYVNKTEGSIFGESDWEEAWTDDRGRLFRALQEEYGRCVSRMYVDRKTPAKPQTAFFGLAVPLADQVEQARTWETVPIGWVFEKRMAYEDSPSAYYLREVWVEVSEDE